jgi:1,2-diacylglycerol 3-alpha-glucosyltransferase
LNTCIIWARLAREVTELQSVKVLMSCTGVGTGNRGIESFFRECFDGLHGTPGLDVKLLKGLGPSAPDEYRVWCLPKNGLGAKWVGRLIHRNEYVVEQLTSILPVISAMRRHQPDVLYTSDSNLLMRLYRYRKWIGVPCRLVYSNGAPLGPPFSNCDHVHQVTPFQYDRAIKGGEPPSKHTFVPYGINVPAGDPLIDPSARRDLRARLGLPLDRPIVLSVGWISRELKRMDYTIDEISLLPEPRPFLMLLGQMDEKSPELLERARAKLGPDNFAAREVVLSEVSSYYQAADVFVLGSLSEGFGRVYIEALMHGLPCVVNDHPVMHYVLGDEGTFADLSKSGSMAEAVGQLLRIPADPKMMARRRQTIRNRFDWKSLAPQYREMFLTVVRNTPKPF